MSEHPFVVVEGPAGVGKSAVAAHVGERLGAAVFHFPPAFLRFRAEIGLDERIAPLPRLAYYLGGVAELSEMVGVARARGPVVCDRYAASPIALLEAEGALGRADLEAISEPVVSRLARPDLTLVVVADHAVAAGRIRARARQQGDSAVHARALGSEAFHRSWIEGLLHHAARLGPVEVLDSTAMELEAMCERAGGVVTAALEASGVRRTR